MVTLEDHAVDPQAIPREAPSSGHDGQGEGGYRGPLGT